MTCDIHLTDTTHCTERVFTTHNSTPHERKIDTENMRATGTHNLTLNILVTIHPHNPEFVVQKVMAPNCLGVNMALGCQTLLLKRALLLYFLRRQLQRRKVKNWKSF